MSAISYTAQRGIVSANFNVSNTDISFTALDNSLNSLGGEFSGLLVGDWVLVSGSVSNNGWHQLASNSVAGKINTTSVITDESAGSSITVVGYKHGLNNAYTLETAAQALDPSHKDKTKTSEAISGIKETLFFNKTKYWDITTAILTETEYEYWLEFLSSVAAGETFTFDAYGTVALPDKVVSCALEGGFKENRVSSLRKYTISFKVRVL